MYKKLTREEKYTFMSDKKERLTNGEILDIISEDGGRVHFIGVSGVSMCSLFCLSRHFGICASGSDRACNRVTAALIDSGEDIYIGERKKLRDDTKLVVYSHAISEEHGEMVFARENGIPQVSRAEYMGAIMQCYENRIGVSGSHGKSTVTAMISKIFSDARLAPTTLSGAALFDSELPFSIGSLDYLIYEACEYKDSFLSFSPSIAVFLNMELDHTDYFIDEAALSRSFCSAMERADRVIVNRDDESLFCAALKSEKQVISFGVSENADYRYEIISIKARDMRFKLFMRGEELGEVRLSMLGHFNISNAVAALAAAIESGIDFKLAAKSLSEFTGIERRLEKIGKYKGRGLYFDYAHHPTEISASIKAIRSVGAGEVTVVFRPHTYSRTKSLWENFKRALSEADSVIILDIDAVREKRIAGVSSEALAREINGIYCHSEAELEHILDETVGDIILMGAGELEKIKKHLTKGER